MTNTLHGVRSRAAAAVVGVLTVLLVALVGNVAGAPTASAAVAFLDRLGCGTTLAERSPVFEFAGGGPAAVGGYPTTTAASGYPAVNAAFTGVSGGATTTTYDPSGYGAAYGAFGALGLTNLTAGRTFVLRATLPRAQRVQLTVGGIDRPSAVRISATAADGSVVTPSFTERGSASGRARATGTPADVLVTGSTVGGPDEVPDKAVDVWFTSPVTTLTFQSVPSGAGTDLGYLVTPPLGCQPAALTATAAAPALVSTDPTTGDLTYDARVTLTATNTASPADMGLPSIIGSTLRSALQGAAAQVQSISTTISGSGAGRCGQGVDGALAAVGLLDPGSVCVATVTARVVVPQSQSTLSAQPSWTWRSSTAPSGRTKASATATVTFPGVRSTAAVTTAAPVPALPDHTVPATLTVTNAGPGTVLAPQLVAQLPAGLSLATTPAGCSLAGSTLTCPLAPIPPGGSTQLALELTTAATAGPGTDLSVPVRLSSTSEPAPVTSALVVRVIALDPPVLSGPTSSTTSRRPTVTGTGRPGATVVVASASGPVCQGQVAADGSFACTPTTDLPFGAVTLTATQQDGSITSTSSAPLTVTLLEPAVPPPPTPTPPPTPSPSPAPVPAPVPAPTRATGPVARPSPAGSPRPAAALALPLIRRAGAGILPLRPAPAPVPIPPPSPGPTIPAEPAPGPAPAPGGPNALLPTQFHLASGVLVPGLVSSMLGTLGPNASAQPITVTLSGRLNKGVMYRGVDSTPVGSCDVTTGAFTCTITLQPGEQAVVQIRLMADMLAAPDVARQQLTVKSSDSDTPNTLTQTTRIGTAATETAKLAAAISSVPGSFVVLLAILLFALAATEAEKRTPTATVRRTP